MSVFYYNMPCTKAASQESIRVASLFFMRHKFPDNPDHQRQRKYLMWNCSMEEFQTFSKKCDELSKDMTVRERTLLKHLLWNIPRADAAGATITKYVVALAVNGGTHTPDGNIHLVQKPTGVYARTMFGLSAHQSFQTLRKLKHRKILIDNILFTTTEP